MAAKCNSGEISCWSECPIPHFSLLLLDTRVVAAAGVCLSYHLLLENRRWFRSCLPTPLVSSGDTREHIHLTNNAKPLSKMYAQARTASSFIGVPWHSYVNVLQFNRIYWNSWHTPSGMASKEADENRHFVQDILNLHIFRDRSRTMGSLYATSHSRSHTLEAGQHLQTRIFSAHRLYH